MVIELDGIVKLFGIAIAIPLTVCGIIIVVYLTVKAAQCTIYFSWQGERCREQVRGRSRV